MKKYADLQTKINVYWGTRRAGNRLNVNVPKLSCVTFKPSTSFCLRLVYKHRYVYNTKDSKTDRAWKNELFVRLTSRPHFPCMVCTPLDQKMTSLTVQNSRETTTRRRVVSLIHCKVLNIIWCHFMVYDSVDHGKVWSICFIYIITMKISRWIKSKIGAKSRARNIWYDRSFSTWSREICGKFCPTRFMRWISEIHIFVLREINF